MDKVTKGIVNEVEEEVAEDVREDVNSDVITDSYRVILTELSLLTTVSALLFGFLLTITRDSLGGVERGLLFVALIAAASSTMTFILPVVYHRLQFPYSDWEKFQARSHRFISLGFPILGIALYLSVTLALWDHLEIAAPFIAAIPFVLALAVFSLRKLGS